MSQISETEKKYIRKGQALCTELGDELVIMHIESGNYITLNKVGKEIWDLLSTPISIEALVVDLSSRFEVNEERCRQECTDFVQQLQGQNLVTII